MSKLREMFDRAEAALAVLEQQDGEYSSIDTNGTEATVALFPHKDRAAAVTQALLRWGGKVQKESGGCLTAQKDGITVRLFGVLVCEILRYEKATRPKMVESGEVEEYDKPVTRCRLPFEIGE
jgi:hypothetical protein